MIAMVITNLERAVVAALPAPATPSAPQIDSGLFRFDPHDLPGFLAEVRAYQDKHEPGTDPWVGAQRLRERLGSWLGQVLAAQKAAQPTVPVAPVVAPAPSPSTEPVNVSPITHAPMGGPVMFGH